MSGESVGAELQPRDVCAQGGLYEVIHQAHREPHKVVVSTGDVFPPCRKCGEAVRFRLLMQAIGDPARARAKAAHKQSRP
jgi:hypothetical protein